MPSLLVVNLPHTFMTTWPAFRAPVNCIHGSSDPDSDSRELGCSSICSNTRGLIAWYSWVDASKSERLLRRRRLRSPLDFGGRVGGPLHRITHYRSRRLLLWRRAG